jgi:hypothetical protein
MPTSKAESALSSHSPLCTVTYCTKNEWTPASGCLAPQMRMGSPRAATQRRRLLAVRVSSIPREADLPIAHTFRNFERSTLARA